MGAIKSGLAFLDTAVQLLHVRGVAVYCPAGTQSCYQTLRIAGTSFCRKSCDVYVGGKVRVAKFMMSGTYNLIVLNKILYYK